MKQKTKMLLLIVILMLTAVACGGDDEVEETAVLPASPAAAIAFDEALTAQPWQWVQFLDQATGTIDITNPQNYIVDFKPDGTVQATADCNNASGSYTTKGSDLSIVIKSATAAVCSPESLSDKFLGYLNGAALYDITNGRLQIELAAESGIMTFISANAAAPTTVLPNGEPTVAPPIELTAAPPTAVSPTIVPPPDGNVIDGGPREHANGTYAAPHYTVADDDTLYSISLRFNVSTTQIKSANGMNNDTVYTEQVLIIPGADISPAPIPPITAYERINFTSGATSATINSMLENDQPKGFVLLAGAGQNMQITTQSSAEYLIISVTDANGGALQVNGTNRQANNDVSTILPANSDYFVTITPTTPPESPTMSFTIIFTVQ